MKKWRIGIIGMGGFAGMHHGAVKRLENEGRVLLTASCDPSEELRTQKAKEFQFTDRGVRVFSTHRDMLNSEKFDVVLVPTPIHMHEAMVSDVIQSGSACYLEKPPVLNMEALNRMCRADKETRFRTMVGFNYIHERVHQSWKIRLLKGEFGTVKKLSFLGLAPRPESYFRRAGWVGKISIGKEWVLDSCLGNALSHQVNNLFFFAGSQGLWSWGFPANVTAELYRSQAVENFDTVFARCICESGLEILIAATHSCMPQESVLEEVVECDLATLFLCIGKKSRIEWKNGSTEFDEIVTEDLLENSLRAYIDYLDGKTDRPPMTLDDTRAFVEFYQRVCVSAGKIKEIEAVEQVLDCGTEHHRYRTIPEIAKASQEFVRTGHFPSDQCLEWSKRPEYMGVANSDSFLGVVTQWKEKTPQKNILLDLYSAS